MKTLPKLDRSRLAVVLIALAVGGGGCELLIGSHERMLDPTYAGGAGGGDGGTVCSPGSTKPCYSGAAGTENVGACKAGKMTCKIDGSGYGVCEGETTPQVETCGGKADTNCDGFLCGDTEWAKAFGPGLDEGKAVAVDPMGNVYIAGGFTNPTQIGGKPLIPAGAADIFVVKLDPKGNVLWAEQFGDAGNESASAIAVDAAGDVVVTGSADDAVDFGSGPVKGQVFVLKLDALGSHVWSTSCGSTAGIGGTGIAFDPKGDVVLVGSFGGTANCGDMAHVSAGSTDILMAKLSGKDGHAVWSKSFGDAASQTVSGVTTDSGGNIFITGVLGGTVNLGGANLGGGSIFAARFSTLGAHSWSEQWASNGIDGPRAIAVDSLGSPVIIGSYSSANLDFGSGALPLPASSSNGTFVAKLGSFGQPVWSKGFSPSNGTGVAVDPADNVAITGVLGGATVNFGGSAVTGTMFAAKLDDKGGHVWSRAFGDAAQMGVNNSNAVASGPRGETFITGSFSQTVNFGAGPVVGPTAIDSVDFFVVKFAPP